MGTPLVRRLALLSVAALLLTGGGCTGDESGDLPAGPELLAAAADEMATVETVNLELTAEVEVAGLPVREFGGVVTRAGQAEGTATVAQFGQLLEVRFVLVDDTFYYQLLGGWSELPRDEVTGVFDPSAVLDPERGVARLLRTATQVEVTGQQDDLYQVRATLDPEALASLVPGVTDPVSGTLWVGTDRPLLHRAEFAPAADAEPVTVALSRFDEPVTITAP